MNESSGLLADLLAPNEIEVLRLEIRFNTALVESVEETIAAVLGRTVSEAFTYQLHAYLGISREDIPSHLKELSLALDGSFGVGGAVLRRSIIRRLCRDLGLSLVQKPNSSLVESIEETKELFLMGAGKA